MRNFIKNHWQLLAVSLAGVVLFFVYAWFPASSSRDLYDCQGETSNKLLPAGNQLLDQASSANCELWGPATDIFRFNSPDETANFFFSQNLARGGDISYQEPLETIGNNLIRPRSVSVIGEKVAPGSFLGLPLIYGYLGRFALWLGLDPVKILFLLTPFFASIGIIFFYLLFSLIFNKNVALTSALAIGVFPGWVYYASRAFYHNTLFISLLIVGVYLFLLALGWGREEQKTSSHDLPTKDLPSIIKSYLFFSLAGFFVGLALIARTSELAWVATAIILILLFNWRKFVPDKKQRYSAGQRIHNWLGLILFAALIFFAFMPVFLVNYQLYGQPLSIGYGTPLGGDFISLVEQPDLLFRLLVSPFGVDLPSIAANGYQYLLKFFWYFTSPALLGLLLWFITSRKSRGPGFEPGRKKQAGYLIILLTVSLQLLIFYGSWLISDRIDEVTVSIGTSYVRYWLPIYLGFLPFLGLLLDKLVSLIKYRQWPKPLLVILLLFLLALPSLKQVYWESDESLLTIKENIHESQAKWLKVRKLVLPEAVVVLGFKQADKIFFPEHKRIIPELAVPRDYEALKDLAAHADLYYYNFADPEVAATISRRNFEPFGLRIMAAEGQNVFGRDWLYRLVVVPETENQTR